MRPCSSPAFGHADVSELVGRDLPHSKVPCAWLDATYVKCRREGWVASITVVTAIGCDEGGWHRVLGVSAVDTGSYDSWLSFLRAVRTRGVEALGCRFPMVCLEVFGCMLYFASGLHNSDI